jgi:elongation factor 2
MRLTPEEAYEQFKKIIHNFNALIQTFAPEEFKKDWQVDPVKGNVAFGSAYHRFGLTLSAMAEIWSKKTGKSEQELRQNFWVKSNFVNGILKPIYSIYKMAEDHEIQKLQDVVKQLGLKISEEVWSEESSRTMVKRILLKWMPIEKAVLDMVIEFLPSPLMAVKPLSENGYDRVRSTWSGDLNSDLGRCLQHCDPNGPVMIVLSKMILFKAKRVVAMGRIFSGTIHKGDKVTAFLPGYTEGSKEIKFTTNIQGVAILMGKDVEEVDEIPLEMLLPSLDLEGLSQVLPYHHLIM